MLIGSYLAGLAPMALKFSDSNSRLLALLGSGILVGTALAVIVPEGVDSLYSNSNPLKSIPSNHESVGDTSGQTKLSSPIKDWSVGVSLVMGFVLMLLIDQFSTYQNGGTFEHETTSSHRHLEYSLVVQDDISEHNAVSETKPIRDDGVSHQITMRDVDNQGDLLASNDRSQVLDKKKLQSKSSPTPTLGLVIHAAADGIALGAAATTSHRDVEMIIFLAIMLHKGPAAFSLVVLLLHRGLSRDIIRKHLLAFSLSAPLAALVAFFGLSQSGKEALRQNNATGIAMLFSAGTFLYVATVHVLPELVHNRLLTPKELFFLVGGSFLPLLLAQTI